MRLGKTESQQHHRGPSKNQIPNSYLPKLRTYLRTCPQRILPTAQSDEWMLERFQMQLN